MLLATGSRVFHFVMHIMLLLQSLSLFRVVMVNVLCELCVRVIVMLLLDD